MQLNQLISSIHRSLRDCRAFYQAYPQIWGTLSPKLQQYENQLNEHLFALLKQLDLSISTV